MATQEGDKTRAPVLPAAEPTFNPDLCHLSGAKVHGGCYVSMGSEDGHPFSGMMMRTSCSMGLPEYTCAWP